SSGTSNEALNTILNLGATIASRAIDRKKKQMFDVHVDYVENAFEQYSRNAF
ncbi:15059_t:CDS:1, partial [Funneliformis geosporum]